MSCEDSFVLQSPNLSTRFETAIVPRWGSSTISFSNVYVSRRPQNAEKSQGGKGSSSAGNSSSASIADLNSPTPFLSSSLSPDTYYAAPAAESDNYTMFDMNIDEVEVTLSFMRWLDGKGLVKDAKVKGVRGVVGQSFTKLTV